MSARSLTIGYVLKSQPFWTLRGSGCWQNDKLISSDELDNLNNVHGVLHQFLLIEAGDFLEIVLSQSSPGALVVATALPSGLPLSLV